MASDDLSSILLRQFLDIFTNWEETVLTGDDALDAVGEIFPFFLGQIEIGAKVEQDALPWTPFGSIGLDQFKGMVLSTVLIVGMLCSPNKHSSRIARLDSGARGK